MTRQDYKVTWCIDIEATSAKEAAEIALEIQRDPTSIAIVFGVERGSNRQIVDLWTRPAPEGVLIN